MLNKYRGSVYSFRKGHFLNFFFFLIERKKKNPRILISSLPELAATHAPLVRSYRRQLWSPQVPLADPERQYTGEIRAYGEVIFQRCLVRDLPGYNMIGRLKVGIISCMLVVFCSTHKFETLF